MLYDWLSARPDVLTGDSFFHLSALGAPIVVTETASVHPSDWPYERAPLAAESADGWAPCATTPGPQGSLSRTRRRWSGLCAKRPGSDLRGRRIHVLRTAPYRPRPKMLPPPDHSPRGRLL